MYKLFNWGYFQAVFQAFARYALIGGVWRPKYVYEVHYWRWYKRRFIRSNSSEHYQYTKNIIRELNSFDFFHSIICFSSQLSNDSLNVLSQSSWHLVIETTACVVSFEYLVGKCSIETRIRAHCMEKKNLEECHIMPQSFGAPFGFRRKEEKINSLFS